ncbi:hypothetical protein [Hyphococcus sp.]|jgi:hypothetical protein|uniref:hypothetical protein n=1 Tax=Hyphococcus sp. TaxID=2038636 RepID=UPI003D10B004
MKEVLNLPVFTRQSVSPAAIPAFDFSRAMAIHSTPLCFAGPRLERRALKPAVESAASKRYRQSLRLSHNGPQALDIYF